MGRVITKIIIFLFLDTIFLLILRKNYGIVKLYDDSGIMLFTKRGIEERMKRRIVACILALTMLLTDIIPVAAGGDGWQGSSFQKTIDWLFGHSSELGYAEIAAVAADMKPDYSLLGDSLADGEVSAGLTRILDSYVRARAANNADGGSLMAESVGKSHRKLWEYFRESVRPYGGSVFKVRPVLQVRDVREAENEITLSVYEWVYMTYEINGRKDISGYGFDHQMVFRAGDEGWTLVQDLWDTGEGDSFEPGESGPAGEVSGDADPSDDQTGEEILDTDQASSGQTGEDDAQKGNVSEDQEDDPKGDGGSEEGEDAEGDNAEKEDTAQDSDQKTEEDKPLEGDAAGEDDGKETDSAQDGDKAPGTDTDGDEDGIPYEEETPDAALGEEVPEESGDPADENRPEESGDPAADDAAADDTSVGDDTYNEDPSEDIPDDQSSTPLLSGLEEWEKPEVASPFMWIQNTLTLFSAPVSMFGVRTLNYTYSYQNAVAYANRYALSYNPAYENYNSIGGDCANFVSQCLYAGGLPMTDKWFFRRDASGKSSRTSPWSTANGLFNYVSAYCGTAVVNPQNSEVTAGNPVFYYKASKGRYSHAAICVGVSPTGVPLVDAHNEDRLRVAWTLGDSWSKRAVVNIHGNGSDANTEVPALPPEEIDDSELWVVTTSSGLHLRRSAGTSYTSIGAIPKNKQINIVEKKIVGEQTWGKTTYNGLTGWCCLILSPGVAYATYISGSINSALATAIKLNKTTATISGIGKTLKLNATVTPSGASTNLAWTSSNMSVATVENGLVTARADGTVVITAQATDGSGKSASCIVSIANKPVTAIKLNKTSISLKKAGATSSLTVSYTPSAPSNPGVTWKSSNPNVVTVDNNGKLKAVKEGSAKITATAKDGFSASASCTVYVGRYTIKYKLNGGKNNSKNKSYYYRSSGRTLYAPTRSGYVFGGWYTKRNLTGKITKIAKGKTTNYTLYAKWVKGSQPAIKKMTRTASNKVKVYIKNKIAGVTGYQVQYATNAQFTKGVKTKRSKSMSPTITGLKRRTRYYVRVRAYTKVSTGNYVYGSYSSYHYITMP